MIEPRVFPDATSFILFSGVEPPVLCARPSKGVNAKPDWILTRGNDPTTPNRQGNDTGTQYRSAIFFHSVEQRRTAELVKQRVGKSGRRKRPTTTEIVLAGPFYPAEDYHQKYLEKNPGGYSCHFLREGD